MAAIVAVVGTRADWASFPQPVAVVDVQAGVSGDVVEAVDVPVTSAGCVIVPAIQKQRMEVAK